MPILLMGYENEIFKKMGGCREIEVSTQPPFISLVAPILQECARLPYGFYFEQRFVQNRDHLPNLL